MLSSIGKSLNLIIITILHIYYYIRSTDLGCFIDIIVSFESKLNIVIFTVRDQSYGLSYSEQIEYFSSKVNYYYYYLYLNAVIFL